jgi:hypothetical protein
VTTGGDDGQGDGQGDGMPPPTFCLLLIPAHHYHR